MNLKGGVSLGAVGAIVLQLLLPFLAGHFLRPWVGGFVARHRAAVGFVDRGSILLVVYLAFSEAVANGIWQVLGVGDLVKLLVVCAALLAIVLVTTTIAARRLGFNRADEIAIVFCGSKKSLASGVPMAGVLFPLAQVGMVGAAADAVPSDPADGLRRAGAALRQLTAGADARARAPRGVRARSASSRHEPRACCAAPLRRVDALRRASQEVEQGFAYLLVICARPL